jgi:hypothetical protein
MQTIRFFCPECGRPVECHPLECKVRCSCGQVVSAASAGFGQVRGRSRLARGTPWYQYLQRPQVRLLIVCGGLAAFAMFFVCLVLVAMAIHPPVNPEADAAGLSLGELQPGELLAGDELLKHDNADAALGPDAPDGPEPLRKAFGALGARQKLDRIKAVEIRGKAHFTTAPNVNTVTLIWQSTHRFKYGEVSPAMAFEIGFVLKGEQGWGWFGKLVTPMDPGMAAEQRLFAYSLSISNLLPLKEKGYELVRGPGVRVGAQDCYTIEVKSAGRPDLKLYFDEASHLLAKSAFRAKLFRIGNLQAGDINFECYYGDYKTTHGVRHWQKYEQFRNGSKYAELNLDHIQFFQKVDDRHFDLPIP